MKPPGVDPEYHRYRRAYPKFAGVATCVDLLRRRNVHGAYQDGVLLDLAAHVAVAGTAELAAAFRAEVDATVRTMLLELISQKPSADDLTLLVDALAGPDEALWSWAARGLYRLPTPEARQALWQARARPFAAPAEKARFLQMLEDVKQWK